jgi:hypothetical protein
MRRKIKGDIKRRERKPKPLLNSSWSKQKESRGEGRRGRGGDG